MSRPEFKSAFILTGPTGSGKSRLALALAEQLNAEIVCMDSMTLYRGMDIGTAKPTADDRRRVPHHLLDVLDPWESASVAWWLERAGECCRDIEWRGRRILFVGGTPLYLKTLLCGLFDGPPADSALRRRLEEEAVSNGNEALHARLAAVDPIAAKKLHPNDVRRIVRALEVYELTGRPMSEWRTQWNSLPTMMNEERRMRNEEVSDKLRDSAPSTNLNSSFFVLHSSFPHCLWLDLPRSDLYDRINQRVQQMVNDGLIDEARRLRSLDRPLSREASQAVGYREVFDHLDGKATLAETVERIQTRTRKLAKRQLTWFRSLPECRSATEELTFQEWTLTIQSGRTIRAGGAS